MYYAAPFYKIVQGQKKKNYFAGWGSKMAKSAMKISPKEKVNNLQ